MVLILNADKMNEQAQNGLLKMIEEPPKKTFFVLIADKTTSFLPTIISRCKKIRFKPLSQKDVEQSLINDFNIDKQMAYIAAKTADADLKKAMMYLNLDKKENSGNQKKSKQTDWIKKRRYIIQTLTDIILTNNSIPKSLMLSQKISLDKDYLDDTLEIVITFFRDLMIFKYKPTKIVNIDFPDIFQNINIMIKSNIFPIWLKSLFEAQKRIASNSSPRLALDKFFLQLAKQAIVK